MIDLTIVLLGIIILFTVLIVFRLTFSLKICALCGAVFLTWLILLILLYSDNIINPILVAILMGGSIVGSIYVLEQKMPKKYQLFKLPYFLTLVSVAYFVLTKEVILTAVIILCSMWSISLLIHAGEQVEKFKILGRKITECCKKW